MPSLPKCRRVKRPSILAKRSQLAKQNIYNKRSYKPLYEKLKTNNNALAKALSKEKQEYQYLFSQNIALTSELQELGVACNKRDDIISGVLKNAKESLQLLITLSGHVTNTIASCQQVVGTTKYTPRKSTNAAERRDSNRRLSGKSPARGVVQPMVSGHMITKPTINLSRLNIQREYRVQNPPNLSDIEETLTTPEQSPSTVESTTPVRIPITRPLNCGTRRVDRMPERLQNSIRTSEENERSSSGRRSNRNSSRLSVKSRRSHKNSPRTSIAPSPRKSNLNFPAEAQDDERLRSPRVALHDVSRLLQNSQSVNIRTLLENSSDMDLTQSQQMETVNNRESGSKSTETENIDKSIDGGSGGSERATCAPPTVETRTKKVSTMRNDNEDPLEGPSWLLNGRENGGNEEWSNRSIDGRSDGKNIDGNNDECEKSKARQIYEEEDEDEDDDDDNDENDDVVEGTVNLASRWANNGQNFYRDRDDRTESTLPCFVTKKRGSNCDDTDDFTLMWRPVAKNYDFDINDLELPVLESPILPAVDINPPPREPEPTTNVQVITTQNFGNLTTIQRSNDQDSSHDENDITGDFSAVNSKIRNNVSVLDDKSDSDNHDEDDFQPRKRKRQYKKRVILDSPSDSEWAPTPKRKNSKVKRAAKAKDPSSAKVVLRKLRDDHVKIGSLSPEVRQSRDNDNHRSGTSMQREVSSDSEDSSNASSVKFASRAEIPEGRPRRQKAPKNLQEPSLGKKLRRN